MEAEKIVTKETRKQIGKCRKSFFAGAVKSIKESYVEDVDEMDTLKSKISAECQKY